MRLLFASLAICIAAASANSNAQTGGATSGSAIAGDQQLRDSVGQLIGRIRIQSNGRSAIYDPAGRLLGTYDPQFNITRNVTGRIIGRGDLLVTLLKR
jgi:hypothetical protein